jgi:opacity protein-like surface antigen
MNGLILGVIAVATIAASAPASAAVKAPPPPAPFAWGGAYVGANFGGIRVKDQLSDLGRLDAIQSHALRDSGVIGGGAFGCNFQHRQFACIRVGHRLQC